MSGTHLSREFFDLVKAIGEAKSKQVRGAARGERSPRVERGDPSLGRR